MARKPSAAASRPSQPKSDAIATPAEPVKQAEVVKGDDGKGAIAEPVATPSEAPAPDAPTAGSAPAKEPVSEAALSPEVELRIEAEVERRLAERLAEARAADAEVLHVTLPAGTADLGDVLTAEEFAEGFSFDGRTLRVRSARKEGRRRAGLSFTPEPTAIDPTELTADQIGALLADPQLVVEVD